MSGRKIGTGITEREDWQPELDLDLAFLSEIEKLAWGMLRKAGLSKKELLRRARSYPIPGNEEVVLSLAAQKATAKKIDSDEWFAALWLRHVHGIRRHCENSPKFAAWQAFELGKAVGWHKMKKDHEQPVLKYRKNYDPKRKRQLNEKRRLTLEVLQTYTDPHKAPSKQVLAAIIEKGYKPKKGEANTGTFASYLSRLRNG